MDWIPFQHAMNAMDCLTGHGVDHPWAVWATVAFCIVVCLQYLRIAGRWLTAFGLPVRFRYLFVFQRMKGKDELRKSIAWKLSGIFLLCALCGYGSFVAAVWFPFAAYVARLVGLMFLIVVNEMFLIGTTQTKFNVEARNQAIGQSMMDLADEQEFDITTLDRNNPEHLQAAFTYCKMTNQRVKAIEAFFNNE